MLAAFLPRFNARVGVPAAQPGSAYRSPGPDLDLANTLCIKHQRRAARDNTVLYQVMNPLMGVKVVIPRALLPSSSPLDPGPVNIVASRGTLPARERRSIVAPLHRWIFGKQR